MPSCVQGSRFVVWQLYPYLAGGSRDLPTARHLLSSPIGLTPSRDDLEAKYLRGSTREPPAASWFRPTRNKANVAGSSTSCQSGSPLSPAPHADFRR